MLKKYLTKFTVDILPSVAATVIGAYIVNHYIVSKPGPAAPVASAVSTADPKAAPEAAKVDVKADAKMTRHLSQDTRRIRRRRQHPRAGREGEGDLGTGDPREDRRRKAGRETSPRSRRRPLPFRPRHGGISLRRVKRLPPEPFLLPLRLSRRW